MMTQEQQDADLRKTFLGDSGETCPWCGSWATAEDHDTYTLYTCSRLFECCKEREANGQIKG